MLSHLIRIIHQKKFLILKQLNPKIGMKKVMVHGKHQKLLIPNGKVNGNQNALRIPHIKANGFNQRLIIPNMLLMIMFMHLRISVLLPSIYGK